MPGQDLAKQKDQDQVDQGRNQFQIAQHVFIQKVHHRSHTQEAKGSRPAKAGVSIAVPTFKFGNAIRLALAPSKNKRVRFRTERHDYPRVCKLDISPFLAEYYTNHNPRHVDRYHQIP